MDQTWWVLCNHVQTKGFDMTFFLVLQEISTKIHGHTVPLHLFVSTVVDLLLFWRKKTFQLMNKLNEWNGDESIFNCYIMSSKEMPLVFYFDSLTFSRSLHRSSMENGQISGFWLYHLLDIICNSCNNQIFIHKTFWKFPVIVGSHSLISSPIHKCRTHCKLDD